MLKTLFRVAALCLATAGVAQAQPYDGPPTSGTRYWEVPALRDYPYLGPAKAVGVILWSHGLAGTAPQYQFAPPPIITEFAKADWDVMKIQRNPIFEDGWGHAGRLHVDYVVEQARKARAAGYKRVIVAGQSYGGAISLEASGQTDQIFGVLALAPGHGSDACSGMSGERRIADMLVGQLIPAVERAKAPRIVISVAEDDECLGGNRPGPQIEQALRRIQAKYIHFDASMPIRGHGAGYTNQFSTWYRDCLIAFMAPDKEPAAGRTDCPKPPGQRFLVPATVKLDARAGTALTGPWMGKLNTASSQEVCVVLDKVDGEEAAGTFYFGPGVTLKLNMTQMRYVGRKEGNSYVHQSAENFRAVLVPQPKGDLALTMQTGIGAQIKASLQRGCTG